MHSTNQFEIDQEAMHLQGAIKTFFDNFSVGTLPESLQHQETQGSLSSGGL
jgi:hypothetical protein